KRKEKKDENDSREPHPPGGFISDGGREYFHSRWPDPPTAPCFVAHHQHVDICPPVDHRHGVLWLAWHRRDLRQASGTGGLDGSGGLSPAEPLVCDRNGVYFLRSVYLAAPGDQLTEVCGEFPGDLHRVRRRDQR